MVLKQERPKPSALKKHSAFIRSLFCIARRFRDEPCEGLIQSCHVRKGFYCMGDKPVGAEVPMCAGHHRLQHNVGESRFYESVGIEAAKTLARNLFEVSGDWSTACELLVKFKRRD